MMRVEMGVRRRKRRGKNEMKPEIEVKDAVKGGLTEEETMLLKLG
jgi:hypothetical protein